MNSRTRTRVTLTTTLLVAWSAGFAAALEPSDQKTVAQSASAQVPAAAPSVKIPFHLVNKHVMLEATVNGSRPLSFILDTGDTYGIVDMDVAKELDLDLGQRIDVTGVGSKKAASAMVNDARFAISGLDGFSQPIVLAIPLRQMSSRLGHDFDGIIGGEFIKRFIVEVDYEAGAITLHDRDAFTYAGPGESVPITFDEQSQPLVDGSLTPIGGEPIQGKFKIDIGSASGITLHSPLVREHQLPGTASKSIDDIGSGGAGGTSVGKIGRIAELKIGKFVFSQPVTHFNMDKAGSFADPKIQANIGQPLLGRFRLFLDYSHNRIIFEPRANIAEPIDRAFSGLAVEAEGKDYRTFRVKSVLENSPGSEAGIKVGDVIEAVDGNQAAALTLSDISEMFQREAAYRLKLRRGGEVVEIVLTTRKMV